MTTIPAPLEGARFRKAERFIIKAHFFIKGYSLKNKCNVEYDLLSLPQRAGLETLYAALLISTRTLHGCSLLENAGAYSPEQPFTSIKALPKGVSNSS
ncbi:hypothetical protein ESZ36_09260 [Colwellia demingiae]|uniref:Uncharacterized protein n=1 Tax=Colwellia demingiae TaxID=89401 RepID=A0A5C6QJT3_9GAMM|nr:hypothetical protein ESZ36_09260 [Colwellia demingiae]